MVQTGDHAWNHVEVKNAPLAVAALSDLLSAHLWSGAALNEMGVLGSSQHT